MKKDVYQIVIGMAILPCFAFSQSLHTHMRDGEMRGFPTSKIDSATLSAVPTDGLVAYYPFNGNAADESGNGNDGIVGGCTLTGDRFGKQNKAYLFNGSDNLINCGHGSSLQLTDSLTLSAWFKPASSKLGEYIIGKCDGNTPGYEYLICFDYSEGVTGWGLKTCAGGIDYDEVGSNWTPQDNQWRHVVVTFAYPGQLRLYLNGTLINSKSSTGDIEPTTQDVILGCIRPSGEPSMRYFDGALDDIRIYNRALSASEIQALYQEDVPIFPAIATPQLAGDEFWAYVKVGDDSHPVWNLFGVSFALNFSHTDYLDVVTPTTSNVFPGQFMGSDLIFHQSVDDAAGRVSVGISRKAGQGGVSGSGRVLRVKFVTRAEVPHGTKIQFSITGVHAVDPSGASISLSPLTKKTTVNHEEVIVWPGDTNNDGIVNQADVLPIGLYWEKSGPTRQNASLGWFAQICEPWTPLAAAYADATGDGKVDQAEVLPIGVNWGKTHSDSSATTSLAPLEKFDSSQGPTIAPAVNPSMPSPNQEVSVRITASDVDDLLGLAFELHCDRRDVLRILSVEPDDFLGNDVVFYSHVDASAGRVAVGITRKAGQGGGAGTGSVVHVKAVVRSDAPHGATINLALQNVVANSADGAPISLNAQSARINVESSTAVALEGATSLPTAFRLYQNQPNPLQASEFSSGTLIRYELPIATPVVVKVYNSSGQEVRTLVNEFQQAGFYRTGWNGRDADGRPLPSGLYLYRLQAGSYVQSCKMLILR